jgi:Ferredoxin-like domain in Api92-like protein
VPNWTENDLTVEGPADAVHEFVGRVGGNNQPLSFESHVPEPNDDECYAMAANCDRCGGGGVMPLTAAEAAESGARRNEGFAEFDYVQEFAGTAVGDRPKCYDCSGTGKDPNARLNWRIANWGTKWDACFYEPCSLRGIDTTEVEAIVPENGPEIVEAGGQATAVYRFETAWTPPIEWLRKAGCDHPRLTFTLTFEEPGMAFGGRFTFANGNVSDDSWELDDDDEDTELDDDD